MRPEVRGLFGEGLDCKHFESLGVGKSDQKSGFREAAVVLLKGPLFMARDMGDRMQCKGFFLVSWIFSGTLWQFVVFFIEN